MGGGDWHWTKGVWVGSMLASHCDFDFEGGLINIELKGYESIGCYTHYVTLSYDFELRFEGQILKKLYHRNKMVDWRGTKRMPVDRMLDPSCDFKLFTSPMTLTLDFQGQIFDSHILGMGRLIDLEWKGCELDTMLGAHWACSWATVHGE